MSAPARVPASGPVLAALTPEARAVLGSDRLAISPLPFRIGRDSRAQRTARARVLTERRRPRSRPNNDLYLPEAGAQPTVSREHLQIEHNGAHYVLVDRQSAHGTLVEGKLIGGKQMGGAVRLEDGDVIIVGTGASPYVFKFRIL
jgi:pSer/pThr/pTyr-binding forkhead associated (FHA) protein